MIRPISHFFGISAGPKIFNSPLLCNGTDLHKKLKERDVRVSSRARSRRKGLESPVAGQVDVNFSPNIEANYSIAEVLVFLGRNTPAGALMERDYLLC